MKKFSELVKGDHIYFISTEKMCPAYGNVEEETIRTKRKKKNRLEIMTVEDNYYFVEIKDIEESTIKIEGDYFIVYMSTNKEDLEQIKKDYEIC